MTRTLFDLLLRTERGDQDAMERFQWLAQNTSIAAQLVAEGVRRGAQRSRHSLDAHLGDFFWSHQVPLELQEYRAVLGRDVRFHESLGLAFQNCNWWPRYRIRLARGGRRGRRAAADLLADMDKIAAEAGAFADQLRSVRQSLAGTMHVLQGQALYRVQAAGVDLAGLRTLEVGPQDGGLFRRLRKLGAIVHGIDLEPGFSDPWLMRGDVMSAALPGPFDCIIATAVFEEGSGWRPASAPKQAGQELLARLHALCGPRAVVVIENIGYPIPFTRQDALRRGFVADETRVVSVNAARGGRSVLLRRFD